MKIDFSTVLTGVDGRPIPTAKRIPVKDDDGKEVINPETGIPVMTQEIVDLTLADAVITAMMWGTIDPQTGRPYAGDKIKPQEKKMRNDICKKAYGGKTSDITPQEFEMIYNLVGESGTIAVVGAVWDFMDSFEQRKSNERDSEQQE